MARDLEDLRDTPADAGAHLLGGAFEHGPVGPARVCRDEHVIDRGGQLVEEALDGGGVVGVEGGAALRREVVRRLLEALRVAAREDDVRALGSGEARGLEPDARAAADHHDGLAEQPRLARD